MIDPNKPIIDLRSTVTDGRPQVDLPKSGTTSPGTSPKVTTDEIPEDFQVRGYDDIISMHEKRMADNAPLSQKQLDKIRKRQKAEAIVSGISDAAQSVANLIATHHYAPDMYDPKQSMSVRAMERFEKAKAERKAKDDEYFNLAVNLGHLKNQKAAALRGLYDWKEGRKQAKQRAEQLRKAEERAAALQPYLEQEAKGKADTAKYKAITAKAEADNAPTYHKNKAERVGLKSSGSRGGGGRSGGGQKMSTWYAVDKKGGVHEFLASSEANAHSHAGANGWQITGKTVHTTTNDDKFGGGKQVRRETSTGEPPKIATRVKWK